MKFKSIFLALLFCSASFARDGSAPIRLALNWKAEPEFGGFYAAQLIKAYKKAGLDVIVQEGGAGTPVIQMVAAGTVEFGIAAADEVVMSQDRGSDVTALFAVYQTNPQGIMVHPERGFKSMADVFNSPGILAIQNGQPFTEFLKSKFSKPQVKLVPYTGGVSTFLSDPKFSQQCFVTSEPLSAQKAGTKTQTFLISDDGFNPYSVVVIAKRSYINAHHETVQKMIKAIREGWNHYRLQPDATHALIHQINSSMDLQTQTKIAEAQKIYILPKNQKPDSLGKMTHERWATLSQQLLDLKLIKKMPKPEELFENSL